LLPVVQLFEMPPQVLSALPPFRFSIPLLLPPLLKQALAGEAQRPLALLLARELTQAITDGYRVLKSRFQTSTEWVVDRIYHCSS